MRVQQELQLRQSAKLTHSATIEKLKQMSSPTKLLASRQEILRQIQNDIVQMMK
jgi:hypothetical protein